MWKLQLCMITEIYLLVLKEKQVQESHSMLLPLAIICLNCPGGKLPRDFMVILHVMAA